MSRQKIATDLPGATKATTRGEQITALLADDHPLIVEGLTTALAKFGIQIVGQTGAANEVLKTYVACRPDVVILDVRFGDEATGLDVARELLKQYRPSESSSIPSLIRTRSSPRRTVLVVQVS